MSLMYSRRRFLRLAAMGTGATAIAACQAAPTAAPGADVADVPTTAADQPPAADERPRAFRYAFWGTGEPETLQGRLVAAFTEKYPEYQLTMEPAPWSGYHEKLLTSLAGGVGAEIVACSDQYFSNFVRKSIFRALDDLVERDAVPMDDFIVDQYLQVGYQGKLYGFGNFISDSPSIYVNRSLTDEAGIQIPVFGTDQFWTWTRSDVTEAALACTKRRDDGTAEQWGFSGLGPSFGQYHEQIVWGNGGEIFDTPPMYLDETQTTIDAPEVVEAFQWMVDLYLKDRVAPSTAESELLGEQGDWLSGRVAFVAGWNTYFEWNKAQFEWDFMPFPWDVRKCTMLGSNMNPINARASETEGPWTYLKFVTLEREGRDIVAEMIFPGPYKPEEMLDFAQTPKQRSFWEQIIARLDVECFRPKWFGSKAPEAFLDTMNQYLDPMYRGEMGVQEALTEAKQKIDTILSESE